MFALVGKRGLNFEYVDFADIPIALLEIILAIKNCSVINYINAISLITDKSVNSTREKFNEKLTYLLYEYVSIRDEGRLAFHLKQLF